MVSLLQSRDLTEIHPPQNRMAAEGETKDCPLDPYVIVHEKCTFVDQQNIKLQEAPDAVPVGELPRHIQLCADRFVLSHTNYCLSMFMS